MRTICFFLLALALAGCAPKPEQEQMVRSFFEHVRAGEFDAVQGNLAPELKTAEALAQLEALRREYVPVEAPTNAMRINYSFNSVFGGDTQATFIHRYDYPDRVLVVTTVTRAPNGSAPLIEGFHVNVTPVTAEQLAASEFSLANKSPVHWAFFAALVCSGLIMLWAFFGTIFTKGFKRKWLFAIISLLGAPVFLMNWTTGEWAPSFAGGLLNLGVTQGLGPVDPWMLRFQVPIGALIVLTLLWPRWMGLTKDAEASPTETPPQA